MDWIQLKDVNTLDLIKSESNSKPIVIFKHSIRCSISSTALSRLERAWNKSEMENIKFYYLDLISFRELSQKIEKTFSVHHESPQILIIYNGVCIYHASHLSVSYPEVKNQISKISIKN